MPKRRRRRGKDNGASESTEPPPPKKQQNAGEAVNNSSHHTYPAIYLSGHARAILGTAHGLDPQFLNSASKEDAKTLVLNALYFKGMGARKAHIEDQTGSPRSTDWVWKTDFPAWLRGSGSIFWITGRAGSGKSVLMKNIRNSQKTQRILEEHGSKWKIVHFFFDFRAKNSVANSIDGMIRSLLYQLLQHVPELSRLANHNLYQGENVAEFVSACMDNLTEALRSSSICVLAMVDGLDEYDGDPTELLGALQTLEDRCGLKLCLASRPYPVFKSEFSTYPQIVVQHHNHESIKLYTEMKWKAERIDSSEAALQTLQDEIIQKADGVFLWARIATDTLLCRLLSGTKLEMLRDELRQMPVEVEDMYKLVLDRLSPALKLEAAVILHLMLTASVTPTLDKLYAVLRSLRASNADLGGILPISEDKYHENRILGVLGDLVDVLPGKYEAGDNYISELHDLDYSEVGELSESSESSENEDLKEEKWRYLTVRNSKLQVSKGFMMMVKFTHATTSSFLTRDQWLSTNLPNSILVIESSQLWFRTYASEIHSWAMQQVSQNTQSKGRSVRAIDSYSFFDDRLVTLHLHDGWISASPTKQILRELCSLHGWTPTLFYAVRDVMLETDTDAPTRELWSALEVVLRHPVSNLNLPILALTPSNTGDIRFHHKYFCSSLRSPDLLLEALERLNKKGTIPAHAIWTRNWGLLSYYISESPCCQIEDLQLLFDLVVTLAGTQSGSDIWTGPTCPLLLMISAGCRFDDMKLCSFFKTRWLYYELEGLSRLLALSTRKLYHEIDCTHNKVCGNGFLCHWANTNPGMILSSKRQVADAIAADLHFLKLLQGYGESINKVCNVCKSTILNQLLRHANDFTERAMKSVYITRIIAALTAGADLEVEDYQGNALVVARQALESIRRHYGQLRGSREVKPSILRNGEICEVQSEVIVDLLEYYANNDQQLPADIWTYYSRIPYRRYH